MITIIILFIGMIAGIVIFFRHPKLFTENVEGSSKKISVIIPARNEEKNLSLLLEDFKNQTYMPFEIICVDDESEDGTASVAESFGAKVIRINEKPPDWTGKSWACQNGANVASGEILLFVDADVRLKSRALSKLITTFLQSGCVISVQPFHKTERFFEQFSIFFNLIQIAANAVGLPFAKKHVGLFGPIIMIEREIYSSFGGHEAVKSNILEDASLGEVLNKNKIKFELFMGGSDISFRMYSGGFRYLLQGWLKNISTGAIKTPVFTLVLLFLWMGACLQPVIGIIHAVIFLNLYYLFFYLAAYIFMAIHMRIVSKKLGEFKFMTTVFYPFYLIAFMIIVIVSFLKLIFHKKVVWKGRYIEVGG